MLVFALIILSCHEDKKEADNELAAYADSILHAMATENIADFKSHFQENEKYASLDYIQTYRSKFKKQNLSGWEKLAPIGYIIIPSGENEFEFDIIGKDPNENLYTFHFVKVKKVEGTNTYKISSDDITNFGKDKQKLIKTYDEEDWEIVWY